MNNCIDGTENIQIKLVELDDCSRQNNIWFDAVKEDSKEGQEECERMFHLMLKEGLDIQNKEIEHAHKVGRKSRNKPRTIVCKLLHFKSRKNSLLELQNHQRQEQSSNPFLGSRN